MMKYAGRQILTIIITGLLLLSLTATAPAADWYVDNVKGSDVTGDGSKDKPFATIVRGQKALQTSDTLHLTPNDIPYNEQLRPPVGGTPEKPLVVDGHGAVIDRLTHYGPEAWKDEGGGIWRMSLPNNAHVMDKHWSGFDLVFFDGKPGLNAKSREEMQPFSYLLFKHRMDIKDPLHNMLYIKLPEGKTPATVKVESCGIGTNIFLERPYTTLRNLSSRHSSGDGIGTGGGKPVAGLVIENVGASLNMDQGISHHGSEVTVRNSRFFQNAGCGIVDVYKEVRVKYYNCIVEDNIFRGGVELHSGEYLMENCIVRNNEGNTMSVVNGAKATLRNCIFINVKDGKGPGLYQGEGDLTVENCTFYGFPQGIVFGGAANKLNMINSAFVACGKTYNWRRREEGKPLDITSDFNYHETPAQTAEGKEYGAAQWQEFVAATGLDQNSLTGPAHKGEGIPYSLPKLKDRGNDGGPIGAVLDPDMKAGPVKDK